MQMVAPLLSQHRQIETCMECSARKLVFTGEVFAFAVKAVVNPVAPLFDPHALDGEGQLKELCVRALRRVFVMCDQDRVGLQLWLAGQQQQCATPGNGACILCHEGLVEQAFDHRLEGRAAAAIPSSDHFVKGCAACRTAF